MARHGRYPRSNCGECGTEGPVLDGGPMRAHWCKGKDSSCSPASDLSRPVRCQDCRLMYVDFPLDITLPDDQWLQINGREGGVLCACCIVRRAAKAGGIAVRAVIEFATHQADDADARA